MKKSKIVKLVLISGALASCHKPQPDMNWQSGSNIYMRSDSTAPYTHIHPAGGWYYAFRPYGYYNGIYRRYGYYSDALTENSNIGSNSFKGSVARGGFGESGGFSVSS